ncbi:hypothetical protein ACQKEK_03305 [Pseudomonas sp. NPDC077408]
MKILISCEVTEELNDILQIINENLEGALITIYAPVRLKNSIELIESRAIVKKKYYRTISRSNFINKILELINFIHLSHVEKPDIIISGFSMMKHRLSSTLFKIKHIAYLRGLMFDSANKSGVSDLLRFSIPGFITKNKLFNSCEASSIITVSAINETFIVDRGVDKNKISLIPPPWLKKERKTGIRQIPELFFITQAFAAHGHVEQHMEQISFLRLLSKYCSINEKTLTVRIHPRDYFDYRAELPNLKYDSQTPKDFLNHLSASDILISPLSTLSFEHMYYGGKCIFYSTPALDIVYARSYKKLTISPICQEEIANLSEIMETRLHSLNIGFSQYGELPRNFFK